MRNSAYSFQMSVDLRLEISHSMQLIGLSRQIATTPCQCNSQPVSLQWFFALECLLRDWIYYWVDVLLGCTICMPFHINGWPFSPLSLVTLATNCLLASTINSLERFIRPNGCYPKWFCFKSMHCQSARFSVTEFCWTGTWQLSCLPSTDDTIGCFALRMPIAYRPNLEYSSQSHVENFTSAA